MRRYMYWVIRLVPNPTSGEFVNIGVLAGNDDSDWSIRLMQDLNRAMFWEDAPMQFSRGAMSYKRRFRLRTR